MKSLLFVPNLLISEPCLCVFACQLRAQIVPFSSLKRACFELNCYRFRAQIVPVSSPTRYSFEPKSYRFRSRTVLLSSPVRAVINHFRTVSIRALAVKYVTRQSLAIFCRKSDSASITTLLGQNQFDSWKLTPGYNSRKASNERRRELLKDCLRKRYDEVKYI